MAKRAKQGGGFQAMIDAQRQKIAKVDTSEEKEKPKRDAPRGFIKSNTIGCLW